MIFEEAYNEFKELEVDRDAKYNTEYNAEQIEEYKTRISSLKMSIKEQLVLKIETGCLN